jgi:GT2 family glycosyltransferase
MTDTSPRQRVAGAPQGPLVSVLIVTWNRRAELAASLDSVLRQTYPNIEIVVIDNASTDGTAEMVRTRYPQALLLRSYKNLGCPSGRNLGFANCRGKYVYMLDDDGWLQEDAVEVSVRRAEGDDRLGVVVSLIKEVEGDKLVGMKPEGLTGPAYLSSFIGCCSMIRRDVFEQLGGFADDFFRQGEEEDFSIRMLDIGKFSFFEPASVMYHKPSPIHRDKTAFLYYTLRNTQKTGLTYWPFPYNVLRVLRNMIYALQFAFTRGRVGWPALLLGNLIRDLALLPGRRKPVRRTTYHLFKRLQAQPTPIYPAG